MGRKGSQPCGHASVAGAATDCDSGGWDGAGREVKELFSFRWFRQEMSIRAPRGSLGGEFTELLF